MTHRLLVPLDGSRFAEAALPYAASVSDALSLELQLLRVAQPGMELEEAENYLLAVRSWLAEEEIGATIALAVGSPIENILEYIEHPKTELVVMSSHGRSGLSRWVYGSVAHKIVHYSPVPILVIRNTVVPGHNGTPGRPPFRSKQIRSILVPLDGSALAAEALAPATRLAASMSATLVLMQVVTPPYIIPAEYLVPGSHVLSEWDRHHAAISYLHEVRETLQSQDLHVTTEVIEGDPAHEITTYAEQHDVDLIAMSTHGRMGLSRWLIGSVTERVLHSAAVPLLVTRPDLTREWQPTNNNKTTIAAGG